jgi:hypothetical protein
MLAVKLCVIAGGASPLEVINVNQHFHDFQPGKRPSGYLLEDIR